MTMYMTPELRSLEETIRENIKSFHSSVLEVSYEPRVKVIPYELLKKLLSYLPSLKAITITPEFLIVLTYALRYAPNHREWLEKVLSSQADIVHISLHQLFDEKGIRRTKYNILRGEEIFSIVLEDIYLFITSDLDRDKIIEDMSHLSTPEERYSIPFEYAIEGLSDEERLKSIERSLISMCEYVKNVMASEISRIIPILKDVISNVIENEISVTCSIVKRKGISRFLSDLKRAVSDPKDMDKILMEYARFLK